MQDENKEQYYERQRRSAERNIKLCQIAMAVFLVGVGVRAILIGKWDDFLTALPWGVCLLPGYGKLQTWGNRHKHNFAVPLLLMIPVASFSLFIGMFFKNGFPTAVVLTALMTVLWITAAIVIEKFEMHRR